MGARCTSGMLMHKTIPEPALSQIVSYLQVPRDFMENNILAESESLLSAMPEVQQTLTRGVTRQVKKLCDC